MRSSNHFTKKNYGEEIIKDDDSGDVCNRPVRLKKLNDTISAKVTLSHIPDKQHTRLIPCTAKQKTLLSMQTSQTDRQTEGHQKHTHNSELIEIFTIELIFCASE